jgi:hypothetical protein
VRNEWRKGARFPTECLPLSNELNLSRLLCC